MNADYDNFLLEYKIHAEYQMLTKHRVPNVYVIPSANSPFIWYGLIMLNQGVYENGVFRFTLFIPDNFECPKVIFNPIVYHPLINPDTGELDVKTYIPNWKRNVHHIYQALYYVRRIFHEIDTKNCVHLEAGKLYDTNYGLFVENVRECVDWCNKKLHDPPPINPDDAHAIKIPKLSEDVLQQIIQQMIKSTQGAIKNKDHL